MVAVSSKKKSITYVIFDVDGLLLGKQSLNCKLHAQFHPLYGEQLDSSVKVKLLGKKAMEAAQVFVQETCFQQKTETQKRPNVV
ncbi:hypothetical protein AB3S75_018330 [Citrus x aurantiifolia]